jgi:hypothetical protein
MMKTGFAGVLGFLLAVGCASSKTTPAQVETGVSAEAGTADTPPSVEGGTTENELCTDACRVMADANCADRDPHCAAICTEAQKGGACLPERMALYRCLVETGSSALACDPTLGTVVRSGYCEQDNAALIACLTRPSG